MKFMKWGCVTPTHMSGRQTSVHQTFFLRRETLPASLEAMAKTADDTQTHWRGCVDWTRTGEGEPVHGTDNYQRYLDTMHGTRGIRKGLLWGLEEISDKHGYNQLQVQAEVQVELTRRYKDKYPGEECPCMVIMRDTFGGERQFAFSMQIADDLQEGVLAALMEAGAPFETRELAM